MDKPTTPGGPNAPNSPWPEDPGSDQGFGATGVFSTVKPPDPVKGVTPESEADPLAALLRAPATVMPQPIAPVAPVAPAAQVARPLAEPVVHKVVFGGGGAESSPELLERMRRASAERAPAAEPASKGNAGFTELLRTLGTEAPATTSSAKPTPAPEAPRSAQESGFTSLLRTLETPEVKLPPAAVPVMTAPSAYPPAPVEPLRAPAAPVPAPTPASGGFTELLRAAPAGEPALGPPQTQPPPRWEAVPSSGPAGQVPAPVENQPGEFTKLFGAFGGAGASPPLSMPPEQSAGVPSQSGAGSFTQMLSLEQKSAPAPPAFREERTPLPGNVDYGLTPGAATPAPTSSNPFSPPPPPEAPPIPSTPQGGAGITRLIQMLDEPTRAPSRPIEVAPPRGPEPGIWTQTFASLNTPPEPVAPASKAPEWTPTPVPPSGSQFPTAREPEFQASFNQPAITPPPASSGTAGPSEFTRILDASRIRELSMRGGAAATNPAPPAPPPQSFAPVPPPMPPMQVPNYPPPMPPAAGGMHGMGGMPQPGGFPPPMAPHAPGMYAPAPPAMPAAPQVPPVKPPAAGLQQYVPLLLVLVIVLLVAVLVTVIFLMKH